MCGGRGEEVCEWREREKVIQRSRSLCYNYCTCKCKFFFSLTHTPQSLSGIDDRMTHMRVQVQQLDGEICDMVRGQANSGHDGGVALGEVHLAIQELFGRIRNIKEKAEQSEHMVKKITANIK